MSRGVCAAGVDSVAGDVPHADARATRAVRLSVTRVDSETHAVARARAGALADVPELERLAKRRKRRDPGVRVGKEITRRNGWSVFAKRKRKVRHDNRKRRAGGVCFRAAV